MANYMFILRPTEKVYKVVCPSCAQRGEVVGACSVCHGAGVKKHRIAQYYIQDRPVQITHIDRDPDTGILRYWENASEFFYETTYPSLNRYVPEVPYGIHPCHDTFLLAKRECDRINEYLIKVDKNERVNLTPTEHRASSAFNF
jgi:hypothetical protein